jgi:hypothetical protein
VRSGKRARPVFEVSPRSPSPERAGVRRLVRFGPTFEMTIRDKTGLIGRRFGLLVVTEFSHAKGTRSHWHVRCDCGTIKTAHGGDLKAGKINSCGCSPNRGIRHGGRYTPTYSTWCAMISRCSNPKNHKFCDYGARGVRVCERWLRFANFLADMGEKPAGMSIDRIDVNGNYEPSNCRWATAKEQSLNTRANVRLTYGSETHSVSEWAELTGIDHSTIRKRLQAGWPMKHIFDAPDSTRKIARTIRAIRP